MKSKDFIKFAICHGLNDKHLHLEVLQLSYTLCTGLHTQMNQYTSQLVSQAVIQTAISITVGCCAVNSVKKICFEFRIKGGGSN